MGRSAASQPSGMPPLAARATAPWLPALLVSTPAPWLTHLHHFCFSLWLLFGMLPALLALMDGFLQVLIHTS